MPRISLSSQAIEDMVYFAKSQPKLLSKIANLLESISKTPFEGIGKPEPLKHGFEGCWSRRVDQEHRLIYFIKDEVIQVISFKGHYQ
jgi:toxin YoeB